MLRVSPFVHRDAERIYDPLTDRALLPGDETYAHFRAFEGGSAAHESLERDGWLLRGDDDLSRRHHLRIVSLETATACNQKCYFCPVSIAPREDYAMAEELFARIVNQLTAFRPTLQGVFLQSYNEPTLDRRFLDQVRVLTTNGLPVAVLSNATGLTPAKTDALLKLGGLRYLSINLSTLDRDHYQHDRGADHLPAVLRNLDYMQDKPVAQEMKIMVLGTGDATHVADLDAIRERFAASRFTIEPYLVMDRAGRLDVGRKPADRMRPLAGCENIGSRPLQHLHITPHGKCVFCCEDYDEKYVVGDLTQTTIAEVLQGDELARLRRWSYGIDHAPVDFMCRDCVFARRA